MQTFSKNIVSSAIVATLLISTGVIAQEDEARSDDLSIEEIVVTGSYIRRSSFEQVGSPVDVVDSEDILVDAPAGKLSEFLSTLPYNLGSSHTALASTSDPSGNVASFGGSSIDIRGIGGGGTLVLLNGNRHTRFAQADDGAVDVNTLVPTNMVQRVEILKDGASAVYGTDAVGGVANFITKDDFDGAELSVDYRGTTNSWDWSAVTFGGIIGTSVGERVHAVAAIEYTSNDALTHGDRGLRLNPADAGSSSGFPGNFQLPTRDPVTGALLGGSLQVPDPDCAEIEADPRFPHTFFRPASNDGRGQCRLSFAINPLVHEDERLNARTAITADLSDTIQFKSAFSFAHSNTPETINASVPINVRVTMPGENPFNIYTAGVRDTLTGALLQQVYAVEDPDNPGVALRDTDGNVVLSADPFNSASGVAFNEDVAVSFRPASTSNFGAFTSGSESRTFRFDAGLEGDLSDSWQWETSYTFSNQSLIRRETDSVRQLVQDSLNGLGGITGDVYLNPFGSSILDPALANERATIQKVLTVTTDILETQLWAIDAVITGDAFEMPAGPVGVAFGAQYRVETLSQDFDPLKTIRALSNRGNGDTDFENNVGTVAVFAEAAVPVFSADVGSLELSIAARYEQEDLGDKDSFNPKVSLLFVNDFLSVRGSYSTSFLAPSLFQTSGNRGFSQTLSDPVSGVDNEAINVRITGNPNLDPQESTSYNVGFTVTPIDNLNFSVDYWSLEFEDLLATPSAQGVIDTDPFDSRIERTIDNQIANINLPFFNASSIEADGIDFGFQYLRDTRVGDITFDLSGTHFLSYDLRDTATSLPIDGLGNINRSNFGQPNAETRAKARFGWNRDNQSAHLTIRQQSEVGLTRSGTTQYTDAQYHLDAQYVRELPNSGYTVTLGAINLLDDEANVLSNSGGSYQARVQDALGRRVYVSLNKAF